MITVLVPMFEWLQGGDHPKSFRSRDKRAMGYLAAGRPVKAIRLYQWTLADCQRELGIDHPYTLRARNNLAMGYRAAGRTAEAIPLLERTLADGQRILGADHPDTQAVRANLAALARDGKATSGAASP